MNRFDRALGILLLLREGNRLSAAELAYKFEVSIRTIYRDVDALGELGVPVIADVGRNGGFRLQDGYFLPPVMLSMGEAVSLLLGATMLRGLRTRPFSSDLDSGEEKLISAMPGPLRAILANARSVVGFERQANDAFHATDPEDDSWQSFDSEREGPVIETFLNAILRQRTVELHYRSPYRESGTEQIVSPLGLLADRDLWYLVGLRAGSGGEPQMWRSDRVRAIHMQTRSIEPGLVFDVRSLLDRVWLGGAMRQWERESLVRIRMTSAQVARLQNDWYYEHATFTPVADGRFEMRLGQDDPRIAFELIRWLGLGAELIEPVEWRDRIAEELSGMLGAYSAHDSDNGGDD